jgi:hypothetical protein
VALGTSFAIAALGAFPYHLLFVFPLASAVTLTAAHRLLRWVTITVSLLVLAVDAARLAGVT